MTHIFTYGSLMFERIWSHVVQGNYEHQTGTLSGYVRRCIANEKYPAILPGLKSSKVEGVLYHNISSEDVLRLDSFEGSFYIRKPVRIQTDEDIFTADTYVLNESYKHILTAKEWDPERFEKEGIEIFLERYFGFKLVKN